MEALFLAGCFVGKRRGAAAPGIFLNDLLGRFHPSSPVPHGFLTMPFAYEDVLPSREFAGAEGDLVAGRVLVSTSEVA